MEDAGDMSNHRRTRTRKQRREKTDEDIGKGYSSTAIAVHKSRSIIIMRHITREQASTVTIT